MLADVSNLMKELTRLIVDIMKIMNRDSVVGIATRYELDRPGIEIPVGKEFSAPVQTGPGASCTMDSGSLLCG